MAKGIIHSEVKVKCLIVAGGGGGGNDHGGGGGGGGYIYESAIGVVPGTAYSVTVGDGGVGASNVRGVAGSRGTSGANSTACGLTAIGGGGGGGSNDTGNYNDGLLGGSGGGSSGYGSDRVGGIGTQYQGNDGGVGSDNTDAAGNGVGSPDYQGAGGGGANSPGVNGTNPAVKANGGDGRSVTISGTTQYYGGGGGGNSGYSSNGNYGDGGNGGGGRGATNSAIAVSGTANTGGGGGGGNRYATGGLHSAGSIGQAGSGGSGIVVIRYRGATAGTGGTITSVDGDTVHTFTSDGTFTYTTPVASWEVWYKKDSNTSTKDNIFFKDECVGLNDGEGDLESLVHVDDAWVGWTDTGQNITNGVVYHVVMTYDGSNLKTYVDGALIHTQAAVGALSYNDYPYKLNTVGSTESDASQLGNHTYYIFRIYDRVLHPSEIRANYNRDKDLFGV
jgi:hypothetical protein